MSPVTVELPRAPRLLPLLAVGAAAGLGKRPRADLPLPDVRLVLRGVRPDPARVAAYARVCGFDRAPGGRTAADPLPLTYPHVLGFPLAARLMGARAFPLPLLGLVHTGIRVEQDEALAPGRAFDLSVHAAHLRPHRRGTEVTVVTEAARDGRTVWRDHSTYLARHRTETGRPDRPEGSGPRPPGGEPASGTPRTPTGGGAGAGPGADLPPRAEWRLPARLGRDHARVSGDYNPLHLHPLTARALGFPRTVAHGMWTLARCVAECVPPGAGAVRLDAVFRAPVLLPSTVCFASDGTSFRLTGSGPAHHRRHVDGRVRTGPDGGPADVAGPDAEV